MLDIERVDGCNRRACLRGDAAIGARLTDRGGEQKV
jgi:hypothetical protein